MNYTVNLPRDVEIDIFDLPENFKEIVEKCFAEYTEGTAKAYQYVDKLGFIDRFIEKLNGNKDANDIVSDCYYGYVKHEWSEYGNTVKDEDVFCEAFMEDCCESGMKATRLNQHFGIKDHHIYDRLQKVLVQVIGIVMHYGETDDETDDETD